MASISHGNGSEMTGHEVEDEYYSLDNGLSVDWNPCLKLEPLLPFNYTLSSATTSTIDLVAVRDGGVTGDVDGDWKRTESSSSDLIETKWELFFTLFIDMDLEGEVNVCSWISSLSELCPDFSEADLYSIFQQIDRENTGFVDVVDFLNFCGDSPDDMNSHIASRRLELLSNIESHPFFQS